MNQLTKVEHAVISKLLEGDEPLLSALREQFDKITDCSRRSTAVGFFTDFTISPLAPQLNPSRSLYLSDVLLTSANLRTAASFILFIRDGVLRQLEGYTVSTEPWPIEMTEFKLSYLVKGQPADERDFTALRQQLK